MSYVEQSMIGLSILGIALEGTPSAASQIAFILMGRHDYELKCGFHFQHFREAPTSDADLEKPEVLLLLERTKNYFRDYVQNIFNEAARQDQLEQANKRKELLKQLRNSNKPHEMGTVAEIAAKYGISKSEVRRRKADGTLHELKEQP